MAITSPAAGTEGSAASGNITLGAPGSPVSGDVWIAVVHSSDQVAHTFTDWTEIVQGNGGSTTSRLSVWYYRYTGSTPNLTVSHSSGQSPIGGIRAFRGCHPTGSPVDVFSSIAGGTDATVECTGVTVTTANNAILVCFGWADDNDASNLSGYTAAFEDTAGSTQNCYQTTAGTPDGAVGMFYDLSTASGGTGTITVTQAASDPWAGCIVVLKQDLTQALTPSLFTNTHTFNGGGNHTITTLTPLTPSLYTNTNTIYDHNVLDHGAYTNPSGEFFYTVGSPIGGVIIYDAVGATQDLTPDLFTNSSTFNTHVITTTYALTPSLYTNTSTFNTHVVTPGAVDLTPSLFTNTNSFNTHVITTLTTLVPSLFTNSSTFNTHVITTGAVDLTPSLYTNSSTFYTPVITTGAVDLTPSLYTNTNTFNTHTLAQVQVVAPDLYTNTNTFNTHVITTGAVALTPSLYTNTSTFNTHVITTGAVDLAPSLYTNSSTFNTHTLTATYALTPSLYTNTSTFNTHTITTGAVDLAPSLYTNSSTFYTHVLSSTYALAPSLYTNSSTFYTHTVTATYALAPSLYTNTNTFYTHEVDVEDGQLAPDLYTNTSTFYTHVITTGSVALTPSLFTNTSTFNTHLIAVSQPLFPSLFVNQNSLDTAVDNNNFFETVGSPIGGVIVYTDQTWEHIVTRHTPDRRFAVIYM